ncbi:MAG TPA: c-type cytochrome [Terriglobales bacterium]|nr:c-type cytochrome [Terriglobales bacterium]
MRTQKSLKVVIGMVLAAAAMVWAQDAAQTQIKHVPIKQTSPASGAEMYKTYCAVCHGVDGRGDGPAAEALKVPPTDLTMLATKNGGKYPSLKVAAILRGENVLAAHGTKDMPIWGNLFWSLSAGHEGEVQQRVSNLNKYVESIQKK